MLMLGGSFIDEYNFDPLITQLITQEVTLTGEGFYPTQRLYPKAVASINRFPSGDGMLAQRLVVVPAQKQVDIKALGGVIGADRLSFGSPDRLKRYLGVDPGSVTILALMRDPDHAVEVVFDESLGKEEAFQFHPLVNTSTLVISRDNLLRFIDATGHEVRNLEVPEKG